MQKTAGVSARPNRGITVPYESGFRWFRAAKDRTHNLTGLSKKRLTRARKVALGEDLYCLLSGEARMDDQRTARGKVHDLGLEPDRVPQPFLGFVATSKCAHHDFA